MASLDQFSTSHDSHIFYGEHAGPAVPNRRCDGEGCKTFLNQANRKESYQIKPGDVTRHACLCYTCKRKAWQLEAGMCHFIECTTVVFDDPPEENIPCLCALHEPVYRSATEEVRPTLVVGWKPRK